MPLYEHTLIARPDLSSQQAQTLGEELSTIISENGAEVKKVEYWGLRTLAYRLKKHRKGHYLHLNIDGPSAALSELERNERIHDDVIRYLTVRVDKHEEGESVIMQNRGSRDRDRDDRRRDRGDRDRGDRDRERSGDRDRERSNEQPAKQAAETA